MRLPRGVYPEPGYILRQAQNEREEELDENSEGLRFFDKLRTSGDEGLAMTKKQLSFLTWRANY